MFKREIHTGIDIDAPAERVWEVLSDLGSYPEWNPMIRRASGELRPGARLELHFQPEGRKKRVFRPRLLAVEPGRELRWLGSPGVPKVLESQHYFTIEPRPEGGVSLDHGMDYYGLLIPLLGGRLEALTRGPFEDMNAALKERSEGKQGSPASAPM